MNLTDRPLIIISLEGLSTSALGCYGSSWNATPAIDMIASGGCVWDRCVATSDDPGDVLGEILSGNWADAWKSSGSLEFLSDSEAAIDAAQAQACFDHVGRVPPVVAANQPATDIVNTQLGRLVAAAVERDATNDLWSLLWLHSDFLVRCWDAPRELFPIDEVETEADAPVEAEALGETGIDDQTALDPLPPIFDGVTPPEIQLEASSHPDLVNSWMRTYGCQVRLVDLMIEVLLESLLVEDPLVMIVGTSGFRLGQGGWIGHRKGPLRSPDIRIPLILSDCGPLRIPQLVASSRLSGWIREIATGRPMHAAPQRWIQPDDDQTMIETRSQRTGKALTTSHWFYVRDLDSSEHLFLKPDDVEDFNDVGRLRGDVIELFAEDKK